MKNIYLCGPIMDLSVKDASEWRQNAVKQLSINTPKIPFRCLDPMRSNFRDSELESRNEIVQFNKADIINSDILLVNATKPSWGTAMEVMFAFSKHKVIIAFTGDLPKNASPWLAYHSTKIFIKMGEAINYIKKHF